MNGKLWAMALGTALLPAVSYAADAPAVSLGGPWYVSVSGGVYLRDTQSGPAELAEHTRSGTVAAAGTQTEAFDPGVLATVAVGTHPLPAMLPGLRAEVEFGYGSYGASYVAPSAAGIPAFDGRHYTPASGGSFERETATFNAFYDVRLGGRVTPYFGGGFGYAHSSGGPGLFVDGEGGTFRTAAASGGTRNGGIAIVEAGVAFDFGGGWSVVPAYRYMRFVGDADRYGDEAAHVFKLGLRRSF